ncbi:helix-turn-helix domain-containing protein [Patescibacteria group bacterium]|nr:helix-turn-helix domain-containing protein [Patescibacteria group bacterium]
MEKPKFPIRVSVSEAAKLFGVDAHTIRRAIKREELKYIVVQSRYKINFESLIEWSQNRITVKNKTEQRGIGQFVDKWKIKTTQSEKLIDDENSESAGKNKSS